MYKAIIYNCIHTLYNYINNVINIIFVIKNNETNSLIVKLADYNSYNDKLDLKFNLFDPDDIFMKPWCFDFNWIIIETILLIINGP